MKKPQNFSNWSEDDFNPSNRPRNTSVEWWNESYVAPARRYRESYNRKTQEEKEQDWRSYPDPLLNPGCPDYWFGWAQDPNLIKVEEKETEEEAESEISYSFPLDEGDSDYPDLTGIDLMIETAPSAGIRLELSEERNKLMFGDSVYEYWKEIQEWYSQSTPVDTSWYGWMPFPDSMLPPPLRSTIEFDWIEGAQAVRQREERIAELQRQIQWEELVYPSQDELGYFGPPELSSARKELNQLLPQDQQALETIERIMSGAGVQQGPSGEAWQPTPSKPLGESLREYFIREGSPGEKAIYLINYTPVMGRESDIQYDIRQNLGFGIGSGVTTYSEEQKLMNDEEYALEFLRDAVKNFKGKSWIKETEYYLEQVEKWKELYDDKPLPTGNDLYNYVPPEKGAFDVASVSGLGLPLTGYGAGFAGMPSGGGGKAESSSLSMPSFPSVGLPSLAGGPSELPSPLGLEGVVGGVPSTPSVGLPSMGWGGAAMPTPSFSPSGMGGRSVAALPSPRSPGGGVTGGGDMGGGLAGGISTPGFNLGGGSSFQGGGMPGIVGQGFNIGDEPEGLPHVPGVGFGLSDRLVPAPIDVPQSNYQGMGLSPFSSKTPMDQPVIQPQQTIRMTVNRYQTVKKEELEKYVMSWMESHSRKG